MDGDSTSPSRPSSGMMAWALALAVLRLAFTHAFEAVPQEAYYFLYSQHPALSYFDHPGVLAWLLWGLTRLLGPQLAVLRLTAFTLTLSTHGVLYLLARKVLPRAPLLPVLVLWTTGAMTIASLISLPDVPLLLFWSLSVLQLYRALFEGRRDAWAWAGLFMGLAFDSKYTAALLPVGLVVFLLLPTPFRRAWRSFGPYVALGVMQLVMAPVYVWNAQHHFASFAFQTLGRVTAIGGLRPAYVLGLVGGQLLLAFPPLVLLLVWTLARGFRAVARGRWRPEDAFLWAFSAPLLGLLLALSLFVLVKPNWTLPLYLTGTLLVAARMPAAWRRWQGLASVLVHGAAALEVLLYVVPIRSDDTWVGWRALAQAASARARVDGSAFVFSADSYKVAAELRFYGVPNAYAGNVLGRPALQFGYLGEDLRKLKGQDGLFLESAPRNAGEQLPEAPAPAALAAAFDRVVPEPPILLRVRGRVVRSFRVYRCQGYHGPPPQS